MPPETLDFEGPIAVLLKEIEALRLLPHTSGRQEEVRTLKESVEQARREIYANLTPWQQVLVARHPSRPHTLDYIERLFTDFTEIHGDRRFGDDPAMVAGFGRFGSEELLVVGHQKGRGTREKIRRNFGYSRPEGYRKAMRAMLLAQKFGRSIVIFVDTPAAYPGIDSEERGVAEAIAHNLREMSMLEVPTVIIITGEGGSGGALGVAIGDRVLILEYAVYSVIPPEGCAAILWRDASKKVEAAEALRIRPADLLEMQVVDEVIPEPIGGAHTDADGAAERLVGPLRAALEQGAAMSSEERLTKRYAKFRQMGNFGLDAVTSPARPTGPLRNGSDSSGVAKP